MAKYEIGQIVYVTGMVYPTVNGLKVDALGTSFPIHPELMKSAEDIIRGHKPKELVWKELVSGNDNKLYSGDYRIFPKRGKYYMSHPKEHNKPFETIEKAIEAANAHNREQWLKMGGLQP